MGQRNAVAEKSTKVLFFVSARAFSVTEQSSPRQTRLGDINPDCQNSLGSDGDVWDSHRVDQRKVNDSRYGVKDGSFRARRLHVTANNLSAGSGDG